MDRFGKASYEQVQLTPGRSIAFRTFDLPRFDSPWHFHPEIELTLVLEGVGRRFVGDHIGDFGPGDLVLVGSGLPHYWHSESAPDDRAPRAHSLVFQFLPSVLEPLLALPEMTSASRLLRSAGRGVSFEGGTRERVEETMLDLECRDGADQLLGLLNVLNELSSCKDGVALASEGFSPRIDRMAEERMNRAQRYILEHLDSPLRLNDVARHINMSPSAFSRYFKNVMGKTFSHFVSELRVGQACRSLLETDRPIAEIAFESGFNNLSNFNRRFLELRGVTPRRFRDARHVN